jgi:hypothetical protein
MLSSPERGARPPMDSRSSKKVFQSTEDACSQLGTAIRAENLNDAKIISEEDLEGIILKPLMAIE